MAKRKEKIIGYSPVGTLSGFVCLVKPRPYVDPRTKKSDDRDAYFTDFLLDGKDAESFAHDVDEYHNAALDKSDESRLALPPYTDHVDYDTKKPTGFTQFRFKMRTNILLQDGTLWKPAPVFVDSKGQPLLGAYPNLGAGSRVKIRFQVYEWDSRDGVGITLQPLHIQILSVVEFSSDGPADGGFGDAGEANGYVALPAADTSDADGGFSDVSSEAQPSPTPSEPAPITNARGARNF